MNGGGAQVGLVSGRYAPCVQPNLRISEELRGVRAGMPAPKVCSFQLPLTPRAGGDGRRRSSPSGSCCFNPRPRAGGDPVRQGPDPAAGDVSIRAPARGATANRSITCRCPRKFQSAPPRGGRLTMALETPTIEEMFQSAPPRGGRLDTLREFADSAYKFQSAPPRGGRPFCRISSIRRSGVSIRAPARGATLSCGVDNSITTSFNPRPRAGGDPHDHARGAVRVVSIRAPARGATIFSGSSSTALARFQSAPPRGGRLFTGMDIHTVIVFQSAPPRGGRLDSYLWLTGGRDGFNPRPRAGGDARHGFGRRDQHRVSIRAPARGATATDVQRDKANAVSIRAPARGATSKLMHGLTETCRFNPRPRAGGDIAESSNRPSPSPFQSAPPRGGRHQRALLQLQQQPFGFNPRPRAGGDLLAGCVSY